MDLSGELTRSQLIDHQLAIAGWNVDDRSQVVCELGLPAVRNTGVAETSARYVVGTEFADCALLDRRDSPLAIVEAKRTSRDALAVCARA